MGVVEADVKAHLAEEAVGLVYGGFGGRCFAQTGIGLAQVGLHGVVVPLSLGVVLDQLGSLEEVGQSPSVVVLQIIVIAPVVVVDEAVALLHVGQQSGCALPPQVAVGVVGHEGIGGADAEHHHDACVGIGLHRVGERQCLQIRVGAEVEPSHLAVIVGLVGQRGEYLFALLVGLSQQGDGMAVVDLCRVGAAQYHAVVDALAQIPLGAQLVGGLVVMVGMAVEIGSYAVEGGGHRVYLHVGVISLVEGGQPEIVGGAVVGFGHLPGDGLHGIVVVAGSDGVFYRVALLLKRVVGMSAVAGCQEERGSDE